MSDQDLESRDDKCSELVLLTSSDTSSSSWRVSRQITPATPLSRVTCDLINLHVVVHGFCQILYIKSCYGDKAGTIPVIPNFQSVNSLNYGKFHLDPGERV